MFFDAYEGLVEHAGYVGDRRLTRKEAHLAGVEGVKEGSIAIRLIESENGTRDPI